MRRTIRGTITTACVIAVSLVAATAPVSAGRASVISDSNFASSGVLVLRSGTAVRDSEVDPNGGLYTAGTVSTSAGVYWRIEHVDAAGVHDPDFGAAGVVMLKARNAAAYFVGLEVLGDEIYAIGSDGERGFTVVRLSSDGSIDRSFGTGGQVRLSLKGRSLVSIADADVSPSGRIVVLGNLADPTSRLRTSSFVARLTAAGKIDRPFGKRGVAVVDVTTGAVSQNITQLALDSMERVVVAGSRIAPQGQEMVVARLTASGAADPGFGVRGVRIVQPVRGAVSAISSIVVRSNDSLALGGWSRTGTAREPVQSAVIVSLTAAGRPDKSFSGDGVARSTNSRFNDQVTTDLLVRPDGSMIMSTSPLGFDAKPALVVSLTPQGGLDTRVGSGGVTSLTYVTGQRSWTQMMHLVGDSFYVLGGTALGSGSPSTAIARYNLT